MSKLDELEEELYGKEAPAIAGRRKWRFPLAPSARNLRTGWEWNEESTPPAARAPLRKVTFFIVGGFLIFLAGGAAFVYFYLGAERQEAEIRIGGRDFVEAGEPVTIPIMLRNVSARALADVQLAISIPEGALIKNASGFEEPSAPQILEHIGALGPGEERTQEITVRLFGREGEEQKIDVSLLYRPERLSARFSSSGTKRIAISSVPLELFWRIPERIVPRQRTEITLRYSSRSRVTFGALWLRIDYPPGFALGTTTPKPNAGNSLWRIPTLDSGKEETIAISGVFDGAGGEAKTLRAGLGSFNESTKEWKPWRESTQEIALSSSPFSLLTTVQGKREGILVPGGDVEIGVRYTNHNKVVVKNVSVYARIEGDIADPTTISVREGGAFDARTGAVVWGPGGTEALREIAPGESGDLHFIVHTRSRPIMRTANDTNLTLRVRTSIDTPDLPQELQGVPLSPDDVVELKVATIALFSGRAVFRSSPIVNTGPLPPRPGEKTTYAIIWEVRNFTNVIENGELHARLPPNIRWEGATYPSEAKISFDASGGEVRWRIGRIPAGTGVLTPAFTAAFQVSVVPSAVDVKKALRILNDAQFSGRDMFTGQDVTAHIDALTTELHDDTATIKEEWYVVP